MKAKLTTSTVKLVTEILEIMPDARDDDDILYVNVCARIDNMNCCEQPFAYFLLNRKYKNIPSYETVSRIRRKVQEKRPDLRSSAEVEELRRQLEDVFKEFARHDL